MVVHGDLGRLENALYLKLDLIRRPKQGESMHNSQHISLHVSAYLETKFCLTGEARWEKWSAAPSQ